VDAEHDERGDCRSDEGAVPGGVDDLDSRDRVGLKRALLRPAEQPDRPNSRRMADVFFLITI